MTYQVLARKWRPQDFSSLVGQEPIVQALRNALEEQRIAQAYLFSGIRGVGKTTAARVLAKALNCEGPPGAPRDRPAADPCNACLPCREITSGSDMDVLEVDAATYSKVEQVRELTESLRYASARDRYKVVVLDEVHRLSRQAFDALLKIVEEPPPHLVFIFATTEIDAVPATILSRCQEFQFRRVPSPVLATHLRAIAEAESIAVSEPALRLIARAGEGSVRDSVALLDQLATFGGGAIRDEDANHLLGGLDAAVFHRLLGAILGGDAADILEVVREIEVSGWDPQHVYSQFLTYTRDALHLALGVQPEALDLPLEEAASLAALVSSAGYEQLLRLSQLLIGGEQSVRRSEFGLLALEIAWLRAAELPKITRIEDVLSGRAAVKVPAGVAASPAPAPRPAPPPPTIRRPPAEAAGKARKEAPEEGPLRDSRTQPEGESGAAEPVRRAGLEEAHSFPATSTAGSSDERLARFQELLRTRRQALAAHFNQAERLAFEDGELHIYTKPGDNLFEQALKRKKNAEILEQVLTEVWDAGTGYRVLAGRTSAAEKPAEAPLRSVDLETVREFPVVQAVLDIFGDSTVDVEPEG